MPSDRAKRLIEALHEPHSLDRRWEIAEEYLAEEREDTMHHIPRLSDSTAVWRKYYGDELGKTAQRLVGNGDPE